MKKIAGLSAFILLIIGTIGLLINEFIFHWGRTATLAFAAVTIVAFAILSIVQWGMRKET